MFDLKVSWFKKVGQVLHLLSLHLVELKLVLDLVPTAAMNEGPPSYIYPNPNTKGHTHPFYLLLCHMFYQFPKY